MSIVARFYSYDSTHTRTRSTPPTTGTHIHHSTPRTGRIHAPLPDKLTSTSLHHSYFGLNVCASAALAQSSWHLPPQSPPPQSQSKMCPGPSCGTTIARPCADTRSGHREAMKDERCSRSSRFYASYGRMGYITTCPYHRNRTLS